MNDSSREQGAGSGELGHDELQSALFAQLVVQQSNLAMMLLGRGPQPESGQSLRDLEAARLFIDQLEMLETKTKGNPSLNLSRTNSRTLASNAAAATLSHGGVGSGRMRWTR